MKIVDNFTRFLSGFWTTKSKYSQTQTGRWKVGVAHLYTKELSGVHGLKLFLYFLTGNNNNNSYLIGLQCFHYQVKGNLTFFFHLTHKIVIKLLADISLLIHIHIIHLYCCFGDVLPLLFTWKYSKTAHKLNVATCYRLFL